MPRDGFEVTLTGIDDMRLRARAVASLLEGAGGGRKVAVLAGADIFVQAWKERVPQPGADHPYSTGRYYDSIHAEVETETLEYIDAVVMSSIDDPPYPYWLEVGTATMEAQPSMIPAWDETKDSIAEAINEVFGEYMRLALP